MDAAPPESEQPLRFTWNPLAWPLYLRVILGVILGGLIAGIYRAKDTPSGQSLLEAVTLWIPSFLRPTEFAWGWTTKDFGIIAGLYIQLLTTLATPLIFFAIVEAFVHTQISLRHGLRMLVICSLNIAVAFAIGLAI